MAKSASHTFGEMIGSFFEEAMKSPISEIAQRYNLYFDTYGERTARKGVKVTWEDIHGSKHDLDYVLEKNGSDSVIGTPAAFIELAWRRYTKHSKNKAQEIAGAIVPIAEKYADYAPLKGAILSGDFTESSINQLERLGFIVLYVPFERLVLLFSKFGVDLYFDEKTKEAEFKTKIRQWKAIKRIDDVVDALLKDNDDIISAFVDKLEKGIRKTVKEIMVLPLHGKSTIANDVDTAIDFINHYKELPVDATIVEYVIVITYNNNLSVRGEFEDAVSAIEFLRRIKLNV